MPMELEHIGVRVTADAGQYEKVMHGVAKTSSQTVEFVRDSAGRLRTTTGQFATHAQRMGTVASEAHAQIGRSISASAASANAAMLRAQAGTQGFSGYLMSMIPGANQASGALSGMGMSAGALGASLGALVAIQVGSWALGLAKDAEITQAQFKVMLGSASAAKELVGDIRKLADTTPLESTPLLDLTKNLLATGVEAKDVTQTLRMLGDVAMGDEFKMKMLAKAYTDVKTKGKLQGQEIRQFAEHGVPIRAVLAMQKFGDATEASIAKVSELGEKGLITFEDTRQALFSMNAEGGKFHGMLEEVAKTAKGTESTLADSFKKIGRTLGDELLPAWKGFLTVTGAVVSKLARVVEGAAYLSNVVIGSGAAEALRWMGVLDAKQVEVVAKADESRKAETQKLQAASRQREVMLEREAAVATKFTEARTKAEETLASLRASNAQARIADARRSSGATELEIQNAQKLTEMKGNLHIAERKAQQARDEALMESLRGQLRAAEVQESQGLASLARREAIAKQMAASAGAGGLQRSDDPEKEKARIQAAGVAVDKRQKAEVAALRTQMSVLRSKIVGEGVEIKTLEVMESQYQVQQKLAAEAERRRTLEASFQDTAMSVVERLREAHDASEALSRGLSDQTIADARMLKRLAREQGVGTDDPRIQGLAAVLAKTQEITAENKIQIKLQEDAKAKAEQAQQEAEGKAKAIHEKFMNPMQKLMKAQADLKSLHAAKLIDDRELKLALKDLKEIEQVQNRLDFGLSADQLRLMAGASMGARPQGGPMGGGMGAGPVGLKPVQGQGGGQGPIAAAPDKGTDVAIRRMSDDTRQMYLLQRRAETRVLKGAETELLDF